MGEISLEIPPFCSIFAKRKLSDKLHNLKKDDDIIKQYGKIKTDSGESVVTGDDEDKFYVVNAENITYYVDYKYKFQESPHALAVV